VSNKPVAGWRGRGRRSVVLGGGDPRARRTAQADVRADDLDEPVYFTNQGRIAIRVGAAGGLEVTSGGLVVLTGQSLVLLDDGTLEIDAEFVAGPGLQGEGTTIRIGAANAGDSAVENTDSSAAELQASINALVTRFNALLDSLRGAQHMETN